MLAIKVPLKDAENIKKKLLSQDNLDNNYNFSKEGNCIFFPVKKKDSSLGYDYVQKKLEKKKSQFGFKEALEKEFSYEEMESIKTAFDAVGDIAILEIDEDIRHKEKRIAELLLETNKNIKTVLRKQGSHEGTFRTQKMKFLAGEKKKETVHKENNVKLEMDVEKVYFSVRLSTERKRISQQVKPEEDILVMFSGAAPYPCVLSKNTEARQIYGIEINPLGHRYGENNIRLNKLNNIFLLNGDVKNIVPKFYQNILGLKCAVIPSQLDNMIKREPKILEFHTFISDFEDNFKILQRSIEKVQKRGIKLWVHQPIDINNPIDVAREDASHPIYRKMLSLVDKYGVNLVLHPSHQAPSDTSTEKIIRNIKTFRKYYDNVFFENGMYSCFFSKDQILKVIDSSGLKSFCIDISHFLYNYKKAELLSVIKDIQRRCTTYFHLNDYKKTDSAVLDKNSNVDMDKILPLVTKGVVEVRSDDEDDPKEQLASFDYLSNFQRTFDRILMPLPKSAEDFLDSALKASKKGTIIHFYDFLHEDNFHEAHEKISAACKSNKKRFKILDTVRCGQHSPRTYRICVDFKIL